MNELFAEVLKAANDLMTCREQLVRIEQSKKNYEKSLVNLSISNQDVFREWHNSGTDVFVSCIKLSMSHALSSYQNAISSLFHHLNAEDALIVAKKMDKMALIESGKVLSHGCKYVNDLDDVLSDAHDVYISTLFTSLADVLSLDIDSPQMANILSQYIKTAAYIDRQKMSPQSVVDLAECNSPGRKF
jgi:hypothetical protein